LTSGCAIGKTVTVAEIEQSAPGELVCPACGGKVDALRARHMTVISSTVVRFCSAECKQRGAAPRVAEPVLEVPRRSRTGLRLLIAGSAVVVLAGLLLGARVRFDGRTATAALPVKKEPPPPPPAPPLDPMYGPDPPPANFFVEGDRWYHPLAGPVRRLPLRPTSRFGVGRDHDSPESCREGHCGVDIGEVKGEPILAAHDGVVERVMREENDLHGGRYVRLLHNGGSVVTQYMHLDTISDELKPGVHVRAGEVIGTLGDTGVHHSSPHLHFTVATRANENSPDVYVDPEPLLTLWPMITR
jgi:murein DD-endopeptidase MepM/ murein hydrolase activator NlpD